MRGVPRNSYSGQPDGEETGYNNAQVLIPSYGFMPGVPGGVQTGPNQLVMRTSKVSTAVENFAAAYSTNRPEALLIAQSMIGLGIVKQNANLAQLTSAYNGALIMTARINAGGNAKATVFDAMSLMGKPISGGSGSGGVGGTAKGFVMYSEAQAQERAKSAYEAVLGRPPTGPEQRAFIKALKAGASSAPAVTKTSRTGKTTRSQKGFDESGFIAGYMAGKIPEDGSDLDGVAGSIQDLIDNYKEQYGVNPTQGFINSSVKNIIGSRDPNAAKANLEQQLKEQAQILYPSLKEKIDGGLTVRAIADPFISSFSKLMEQNDLNVGLDNKFVREALSNKNEKGEYQIMDQDSFARKIKSTDEWLNTRNAKETMLSAADGILKQFGFRR